MTLYRDIVIVLIVILCTFFTRAFPFLLFGRFKKLPAIIEYLGKLLPSAVIVILIVYCSRGVRFDHFINYFPYFASMLLVLCLHLWKRNNLLSIGAGTLCYMFMIQMF